MTRSAKLRFEITAQFRSALALIVALSAACKEATPSQAATPAPKVACTLQLDPSLVVEIRDQNGNPAARGATVSAVRSGRVVFASPNTNTRPLYGVTYGRAKGSVDVRVTKLWYAPATIKGVQLVTDACGHGTVNLSATINLLANAPPVRQVVTPYQAINVEGAATFPLADLVHVETASGISQQATWVSRNPAIASITSDGKGRSACLPGGDSVWLVASSAADAKVKDSIRLNVRPSKESEACRQLALGAPYIRGVITAIISGYGVRDANGPHAVRNSQMRIRTADTDAASINSGSGLVSWTVSTKIRMSSGAPVTSEALKVGRTVSVWIAKPARGTLLPDQATATDVVIDLEPKLTTQH
jgi:hypothetical protein